MFLCSGIYILLVYLNVVKKPFQNIDADLSWLLSLKKPTCQGIKSVPIFNITNKPEAVTHKFTSQVYTHIIHIGLTIFNSLH